MFDLYVISRVFGRLCLGKGFASITEAKTYIEQNNWDGYYSGLIVEITEHAAIDVLIETWTA